MSTTTPGSPWARWLQNELDSRGWEQADLLRSSRKALDSGTVSRWLSGKTTPSMDLIRVACSALGVPPVQGMIAAGHLEPGDVGATVVRTPAGELTGREIGADVVRRLTLLDALLTADDQRKVDDGARKVDIGTLHALGQEGEAWAARRPRRNKPDNAG